MNKEKFAKGFILSTMIGLYVIVSLISTLHVIEFFEMSNPSWLAISLAIAFEIGAAASLASIIVLDKTSKVLVWSLFILLTAMQMQGNMFYAYTHLENFKDWIELFGLQEEELITQKRILAIVSGAILPVIALGFIKSLVDYIRPDQPKLESTEILSMEESIETPIIPEPVIEAVEVKEPEIVKEVTENPKVGTLIVEPKYSEPAKHYNPKP
jgi:glucan phosphoethanolaminetransferase (alkaline phosphatase superfamily)